MNANAEQGTRLLVAAGAAGEDVAQLPPLIRGLISRASEVLVITPVLVDRLRWLASDTDRARYEADERLGTILAHFEMLAPGAVAQGQVGDDTPLTALDDAVRTFQPDHVLIALRAADNAAWQERQLVERALARFHTPITVFEIDRSGRVPTS